MMRAVKGQIKYDFGQAAFQLLLDWVNIPSVPSFRPQVSVIQARVGSG